VDIVTPGVHRWKMQGIEDIQRLHVPLTLKSDDHLLPCVTVASNGSETELWAAAKLSQTMSLPLIYLPSAVLPSQIAVGHGAATALGTPPSTLSALGDDAFFISVSDGSSLVIASSATSARGSMNGVYEFMRMLGFKFLAANVTTVPKPPWNLPMSFTNVTFDPPFHYRDISTSPVMDHSARDRNSNHVLSASMGLNGQYAQGPVGGSPVWAHWGRDGAPLAWPRVGFVATAFALLSPHLLGGSVRGTPDLSVWRQHPEWFVCSKLSGSCQAECPPQYPCILDEINKTYHSQPCWSNTSLQKYMASSILRILQQNPNATSISVSNMDGTWVVCPADDAANKAENSTGGANFRAVQAIADIVSNEFPRVKIATLAYDASLAAPAQLKFGSNVIVQLCLQDMAHFVPLSHPLNKPIIERVRAWARAVPTLWIWDYTVSFYSNMLPWANYYTQANRIQELHQLGVKGYFGQGWDHAGVELIDLKTYVASRTAFDPSLNIEELTVEFTDGFYSTTAAVHVRAYMHLMATAFNTTSSRFNVSLDSVAGLNSTLLAAASALQAAKRVAAPGEDYQLRLSQAMMSIQFVALQRWNQLREHAAGTKQPWPLAPTLATEFERFTAAMKYAFRDSNESPHFSEDLGQDGGHHKVDCDLACFAKQLGLHAGEGPHWSADTIRDSANARGESPYIVY
jgi:hypothetical protein